jgi:hypothetical protein
MATLKSPVHRIYTYVRDEDESMKFALASTSIPMYLGRLWLGSRRYLLQSSIALVVEARKFKSLQVSLCGSQR